MEAQVAFFPDRALLSIAFSSLLLYCLVTDQNSYICVIVFIAMLGESVFTHTAEVLMDVKSAADATRVLEEIREADPEMSLQVECWHEPGP